MLNLLRSNSELRRIFAAHAVSRAGDSFNTVALVVLVFDLTGSARKPSSVTAFAAFHLVGGLVAVVGIAVSLHASPEPDGFSVACVRSCTARASRCVDSWGAGLQPACVCDTM